MARSEDDVPDSLHELFGMYSAEIRRMESLGLERFVDADIPSVEWIKEVEGHELLVRPVTMCEWEAVMSMPGGDEAYGSGQLPSEAIRICRSRWRQMCRDIDAGMFRRRGGGEEEDDE